MAYVGLAFLALILAVLASIAFYPIPGFDPVDFREVPSKPPLLEGVLATNEQLKKCQRLLELPGPEDSTFDKAGNIYTGLEDGRIIKIDPNSLAIDTIANTGGRPLALEFNSKGALIVADAYIGLISVDISNGQVTVLANTTDGQPIIFADALAIASDDTIYFTEISTRYQLSQFFLEVLDGRPSGRISRYDPKTKSCSILVSDLYTPNGIILSEDEESLIYAESIFFRIKKYYLKGPKIGTLEIFVDSLPGVPDNLGLSPNGDIWVALPLGRYPFIEQYRYKFKYWNKINYFFPTFKTIPSQDFGGVLLLNKEGKILRAFYDTDGSVVHGITSAKENNGFLYIGHLFHHFARCKLEELGKD